MDSAHIDLAGKLFEIASKNGVSIPPSVLAQMAEAVLAFSKTDNSVLSGKMINTVVLSPSNLPGNCEYLKFLGLDTCQVSQTIPPYNLSAVKNASEYEAYTASVWEFLRRELIDQSFKAGCGLTTTPVMSISKHASLYGDVFKLKAHVMKLTECVC